jgi:hypothetical protein
MAASSSAPGISIPWGSELNDADFRNLAARWITPELARQMQLRRVISDQGAEILGRKPASGHYEGILIPNIAPGESSARSYRIRRDRPDIEHKSDGTHKEKRKYLSPPGDRNTLYFVPGTDPAWLNDLTLPIVLAEGEFKAASLSRLARHGIARSDPQPRFLACAVSGAWNWRGKVGKATGPRGEPDDVKGPIPDLDRITWTNRRVVLFFDVDVLTNETVGAARNCLARELQDRGASVFLQQPPREYDSKGVDDLLAAKGPELVLHLIEHPTPAKPRRRRVSLPADSSNAPDSGGAQPSVVSTSVPGQYEATGGKLLWWRPAGQQLVPTPLANFDARIASEVVKDDGTEQTRFYEIIATHSSLSYTFHVRATEFDSLHWVAKFLPAPCVIFAGRGIKDNLPVAIKTVSGAIPRRTIFTHTGWTSIEGKRAYLHADGAISASGVLQDIAVELPPDLSEFRLPAPPDGHALVNAIRASLTVLDVGPRRITIPLLLTPYRAVLGEANFSVFEYGESGVQKSCLAALVQQHFGAGMDSDHLPGNWESTENYSERLAHLVKDAVLVLDDFVPAGDLRAVQKKHALADRLLRGQANRQARGRLQSDISFRAGYKPRGILVATGEELPRGQSLRARLLGLLVTKGDVRLDALTSAQQAAADKQFSLAMAGFVRYVAEHWDDIQEERRSYTSEAKLESAETAAHGRGVAMRHELRWAARIFSEFAVDAGAMTALNANDFLLGVEIALQEVAAERTQEEQEADIARRSLELLSAAITRGDAYLAHPKGLEPDEPERYGWRRRRNSDAEEVLEPRGSLIGWVDADEDRIYLEPSAAFAGIQAVARATNEPLSASLQAWIRALNARGFLEQKDTKRRVKTCRKTLQGQERPVLALKQSALGV